MQILRQTADGRHVTAPIIKSEIVVETRLFIAHVKKVGRARHRHVQQSPLFGDLLARGSVAPYMTFDETKLTARFDYVPPREEIPVICAEHLVVEYYSR